MKKRINTICIIGCFIIGLFSAYSQIGIGISSPDSSSVLDITSRNSGLLIPRLSTAERNAILEPANGLIIFNTDKSCLEINFGTKNLIHWECAETFNSSTVNSDCFTSGFEGIYINGVALDGSHTFTVSVTNNTLEDVNINFSVSDLVLSGVSGISVNSVTPTSAIISSGSTQLVEYRLSGTPDHSGNLTGVWNTLGLNCRSSVQVVNGNADFSLPQTIYAVSISDGSPLVEFQGIIDNVSNQYIIQIPYTDGIGTYEAFQGIYTVNNVGTGEEGDVNSFRLSYSGGTFSSSGTITATIEVDGDGSFNARKQLFNMQDTITTLNFSVNGLHKGNVHLEVLGGIPDRNFADTDHQFIYTPVIAADGNTWLNNNLGANYANVNHPQFNPVQQAVSFDDHHAYGSLYQWGRYSDGHELISYTNSTTGSGVYGTTTVNASSDTPVDNLFITESTSPFDWRTPQNNSLWQGEAGVNNPCPQGYRVPTLTEITTLRTAEGITNRATAFNSALKFPASGLRQNNGSIINEGSVGIYWSSTTFGIYSYDVNFLVSASNINAFFRSGGLSIRCIKD